MVNGFGNTSYSYKKKVSFLDRDKSLQRLLVLREVSYSLEVLKSLEEAKNEANTTFLRVFNI